MQTVAFQEIEVDRCGGCHGIWFDAFELEQLAKLSGSEVIEATEQPSELAGAAVAGTAAPKVSCPHCLTPMIGLTAHGQPHIRFESCAVCYGAFLDAGEFQDFKVETLAERMRFVFRRR
jgi:Zn-finger nucleic acid-binding protein